MAHPTTLSTRETRTLVRIYQHPMTHNLELRDVTTLFETIGGAETQHNGEIRLSVGEDTLTLARPHTKDMTTDEVILVRKFLTRSGWGPESPDTVTQAAGVTCDMAIVIDHTGARIHHLGRDDDPVHIPHHVDAKDHDRDREETFPDDQQFFSNVADKVAAADRIVVISHGTGQSNEGAHFLAWLASHRKDLRARVAQSIVADLPHTTTPKLLDLAATALAQLKPDATLKGAS